MLHRTVFTGRIWPFGGNPYQLMLITVSFHQNRYIVLLHMNALPLSRHESFSNWKSPRFRSTYKPANLVYRGTSHRPIVFHGKITDHSGVLILRSGRHGAASASTKPLLCARVTAPSRHAELPVSGRDASARRRRSAARRVTAPRNIGGRAAAASVARSAAKE